MHAHTHVHTHVHTHIHAPVQAHAQAQVHALVDAHVHTQVPEVERLRAELKSRVFSGSLYRLDLGIANGMSIAWVWACRYSK